MGKITENLIRKDYDLAIIVDSLMQVSLLEI
jgi:hypothetical protein